MAATALRWAVVEGPVAEHAPGDRDRRWAFVLAQGGARRRMVVEIAAALLEPAPGGPEVRPRTAEAIATRGRSEVEAVSLWWDPPDRSVFDARNQPSRLGGKP